MACTQKIFFSKLSFAAVVHSVEPNLTAGFSMLWPIFTEKKTNESKNNVFEEFLIMKIGKKKR